MGLIEQAAKRLEELKRAGMDVPVADPADASAIASPPAAGPAVPARAVQDAADASAPVREAASVPEEPSRRSRLIEIDLPRLAAAGYVTPTSPRSRLADEMRVIKRPLLGNAQGKSAAPVHSWKAA